MVELWHKNEIIYGVAIDSFCDSDGNGLGDLAGLIEKLDYLQSLGVTCLWMLPFFPSPNFDNGYDVSEYTGVDHERGTIDEFRRLVEEAHRRGIRVVIDLIAHHTSRDHPWFQSARSDAQSPYRDYYIWSDSIPQGKQPENIFPTIEQSVWHYDELAGSYYFHLFYNHEPDLHFANSQVQEEILAVADYWMSCGIDGFRVDATNHLFEEKGLPGTGIDNPCSFLNRLHATVTRHNGQALLLAEADTEPGAVERFVCDGAGIPMYFNFLLNNYLFLAFARESAMPILDAFDKQPLDPETWVWVNFLRNLDELDLERLTESEREEVYNAFAPQEEMRIYNRGIRRRLAPILDGDARRLKLAFSLLFSLPGSPLLVYGDEIGMGDDLSLPERESVRTPMQWNSQAHAGFSVTPQHSDINPVIDDGPFGYECVNVDQQQRDDRSLLAFVQSAIRLRRELPHFRESRCQIVSCSNHHVLAFSYEHGLSTLLVLHNFSRDSQQFALDEPIDGFQQICEADGTSSTARNGAAPLGPYEYRWLIRQRS
jgi:maltose alpha-D-glucosyltransferase / alpha-amylase